MNNPYHIHHIKSQAEGAEDYEWKASHIFSIVKMLNYLGGGMWAFWRTVQCTLCCQNIKPDSVIWLLFDLFTVTLYALFFFKKKLRFLSDRFQYPKKYAWLFHWHISKILNPLSKKGQNTKIKASKTEQTNITKLSVKLNKWAHRSVERHEVITHFFPVFVGGAPSKAMYPC